METISLLLSVTTQLLFKFNSFLMFLGDIISSSATTIHNMYLINVFEAICKLLLDFASVPVLCNGSKFNVLQNEGNESTSGDVAGSVRYQTNVV